MLWPRLRVLAFGIDRGFVQITVDPSRTDTNAVLEFVASRAPVFAAFLSVISMRSGSRRGLFVWLVVKLSAMFDGAGLVVWLFAGT